ncbi:glycosyltransferase family 1 protein [soil metagenome]
MSTLGSLGISAVAYQDGQLGGLNRYTGEMVAALTRQKPEVSLYTASIPLARRHPQQSRLIRPQSLGRSDFKGNFLRLIWHQTSLPRHLKQDGVQILYSPVAEGMIAPTCRQVITIHDLLPLRFPRMNPRLRYYFQYVLPRIVRGSAAVITVSEATRGDLRRFFGASDTPVHVVHGAYDARAFSTTTATPAIVDEARRKHRLGEYILAVGETRPYKNTRRLIKAFARLRRNDLQLAIVGKTNKMDPDLEHFPRGLGVKERVRFLGYVSDRDLAALYGGAAAFVFPSLYEGFGIPPLEAMACGCPVVCSRAASLPEVCGDAAEYVDPLDVGSIAAGISRVLNDASLRSSLREKGRERVRAFSYDKAAAEIVQILDEVAGATGSQWQRWRWENTHAAAGRSPSAPR